MAEFPVHYEPTVTFCFHKNSFSAIFGLGGDFEWSKLSSLDKSFIYWNKMHRKVTAKGLTVSVGMVFSFLRRSLLVAGSQSLSRDPKEQGNMNESWQFILNRQPTKCFLTLKQFRSQFSPSLETECSSLFLWVKHCLKYFCLWRKHILIKRKSLF